MTPVLYPANETAFTSNGLGRLSGAISCNVHEAINGAYELVMVYPIDGIHYEDIAEGRYIYAAHDDSGVKEPFEIFENSRPFDGKVEIHAWHWSYRLNKVTVLPHVSSSAQAAVQDIKNYAANDCPFSFSTDISSTSAMTVKVPTSARSLMGGVAGSAIDTYGGEWEFLGSQCILRSQRGTDSGVTIKYGKNLTDAKKTTSTENVWTGIVPYYTDGDNCVYYNGVIYSTAKDDYAYTMVIPVDASTSFASAPTQAQLKTWGEAYVRSNAKTSMPTSIDISFVQLWQTDEYKDVAPLQRLYIGDTVTIQYTKLGISNKARIVEYDYNVLLDRYDSMTIGNVRANFATTVQSDIVQTTEQLSSKFSTELQRATNAITGVSGGAFVINTDANGHPYETLWMNTDDKATATRVIRINYEGIAMGSGYNGPFSSAWLAMDGTFDAQNINVIHLDAGSIETGLLQSTNGKVKFDLDAGTLTLGNKALRITAGNFQLNADGDVSITGDFTSQSGNVKTTLSSGIMSVYRNNSLMGKLGMITFNSQPAIALECDNANGLALSINGTAYYVLNRSGMDYTGYGFRHYFNGDLYSTARYKTANGYGWGADSADGHEVNIGCDVRIGAQGSYGFLTVSLGGRFGGNVEANAFEQTSDRNKKQEVTAIRDEEALRVIKGLQPVTFRWRKPEGHLEPDTRLHHGFIAQDVRELVLDDWGLVTERDEGLTLNYTELLADAVSVIQQQQEKIDELEARLARIEELLSADLK